MQMPVLAPVPALKTKLACQKLLISVPAYNEAENIGAVLDDILSLKGVIEQFDIVVVDDGSTDDTRKICESKNVTVISHIYNMGYGAALKTSYKYAYEYGYDYIIQMDADGQHDISNIEHVCDLLAGDQDKVPDIIIGSRFLQNSVSFRVPFYKKMVIAFFNIIIKAVTKNKITDPTSGFQGLNRKAFTFYAQFENFSVDYPDANMIIQMALNNFTVGEIPAVMHPRLKGVSMHSGIYKPVKYIVMMTLSVLIICIRELFYRRAA